MVYSRFVEVGRIALVSVGPHKDKLVTIVDVIDQNRALVDGPTTNVPRQAMNFKALLLTDFKVPMQHGCRSKAVRKAVVEGDVDSKWKETAWAKKIAQRKLRSSLTDFDRFKVKVLKQKKSRIVRTRFNKLKKAQKV